jgi:hypothetical protein
MLKINLAKDHQPKCITQRVGNRLLALKNCKRTRRVQEFDDIQAIRQKIGSSEEWLKLYNAYDCRTVVKTIFNIIKDGIIKDRKCSIAGFGTFKIVYSQKRSYEETIEFFPHTRLLHIMNPECQETKEKYKRKFYSRSDVTEEEANRRIRRMRLAKRLLTESHDHFATSNQSNSKPIEKININSIIRRLEKKRTFQVYEKRSKLKPT